MSRFDAVGVGALNCDLFFEVTPEQLESINRESDKPFVLGKEDTGKPEEFEKTLRTVEKYANFIGQDLGGSALQTIIALSRIKTDGNGRTGFTTGYLGMVGRDRYGQFLREKMQEEGVATSRIFRGEIGSGRCISLSDGRDRALMVFPFSNDLLGFKHLNFLQTLEEYLAKSKIVHMTSFVCSLGYEPLDVQKKIAEQLGKRVKISFGPGELYVNLGLKTLQPILQSTHVLFLNRREMWLLTGEDYREGSRKLLELGPYYVVCTLGKDGSYLRSSNGGFLAEVSKLDEIETKGLTGAGDYFAAGFLAGLLRQHPPEYCMNLGNRVAEMKLKGLRREAYQNVEV